MSEILSISRTGLVLGFAACLSVSCGRKDRVEVVESRATFKDEVAPKLGLTTAQRYAANDAQAMLRWTTPEGWRFLAATEFRHLNFDFGPNREGECYLTLLPVSSGGGLLDNWNRWRKQMGQDAQTEGELEAQPTQPVFGRPAPFLDITGEFTGGSGPMMAAAASKPNYRMLGTIFAAPGFLFTIKMTGPAALVEENAAKFRSFCETLGAVAPEGNGV